MIERTCFHYLCSSNLLPFYSLKASASHINIRQTDQNIRPTDPLAIKQKQQNQKIVFDQFS